MTSLKNRFIFFGLLVALLAVVSAWLGHERLAKAQEERALGVATRNQLLEATHHIGTALLEAYQSMDVFLLAPTEPSYRDNVYRMLDEAIGTTRRLRGMRWIARHDESSTVDQLLSTLLQLRRETDNLFVVRLDPYLQYPSMAAARAMLSPNRERADAAWAIVTTTMDESALIRKDPEAYDSLVKARYVWDRTISNFRIYLANRVGSFNEDGLPTQEKAIATLFEELETRFQQLLAMDGEGRFSFEISTSLEDIRQGARDWYAGFNRVVEIHHSKDWRIDAKLMKDTIAPIVDAANQIIRKLDGRITGSVADDLALIEDAAGRQTFILLVMSGLVVVFIAVVVVSTGRMIFEPIAIVARGLKAQALGKTTGDLPVVHSRETRDLVEAFREMSRQVHQRQTELQYHALHDTLTSLPNRALLRDRIERGVHMARRDKRPMCLLIIDLDRFKEINDTFGHNVGDRLLVDVGQRLLNTVRDTDTVARLGGDEFAVVLRNTDRAGAAEAVGKIREAMEQAFTVNELQLFVAASVGGAFYPEHGTEAQDLLRHADVAMYHAKRNQLGYAVYSEDDDPHSVARFRMINDLREALAGNALSLCYQPKIQMKTGRVVGLEALLRWHQSDYGSVPPDHIVELAEQTGLINPLTYWVVETALSQIRHWRQRGFSLGVSVNLSVHNLQDDRLPEEIIRLIEKFDLPTDTLTLEITESAMMANPLRAVEILSQLDERGIRLSIDDFGTGFSSLAYLKQLPVDELKVDKSFILNMDRQESDETIVRSTVDLAHNLGLSVVAEGVENRDTWSMLQRFGCDEAQGYFMSRPQAPRELEAWLARTQTKEPVNF